MFKIGYPTFGCQRVAFKSHHGEYIVALSNGAVIANRDQRIGFNIFTVEELGSGSVALKSCYGKYLVAEDKDTGYQVNANRDQRREWEIFKVLKQPNGTVAFRTAHGRYLFAERNGSLRADLLCIREWKNFGEETFTPVCVPGKSMRYVYIELIIKISTDTHYITNIIIYRLFAKNVHQ